jgi:hypothetical protein
LAGLKDRLGLLQHEFFLCDPQDGIQSLINMLYLEYLRLTSLSLALDFEEKLAKSFEFGKPHCIL